MYLVYENKIHSFIYKEREHFVPMGMQIIFFLMCLRKSNNMMWIRNVNIPMISFPV